MQSFEAEAQLDDIRKLLDAAHGGGLLLDVDYAQLIRLVAVKNAVLVEEKSPTFSGGMPDWMRWIR
ncbi:hypothetical protein [Duganella levis]|uniref:Uncharacterized protein n=1 Tax=Duganella levis TaxID=2692169 RepID=A0ABW9W5J9_9BURK|nr:hypothetical protein [Duganella levis]MYN29194.1 hypothetical protein [Duganella levis]